LTRFCEKGSTILARQEKTADNLASVVYTGGGGSDDSRKGHIDRVERTIALSDVAVV
jgi:hypothetical protein